MDMARLFLVKNQIEPAPPIFERAKTKELPAVEEWLQREFGNRAVAICSTGIVGFDEFSERTGQLLQPMEGSVAGVFQGVRHVAVRKPRDTVRSHLGTVEMMDLAVFSTSHGPAEISNHDFDRMQNNDTSVASLFGEIGVALSSEVSFGPLRDNSSAEENEGVASPAKLRVVR